MPINTPYYNDNIDLLLPTNINQFLYQFDEYQTYDLIVIYNSYYGSMYRGRIDFEVENFGNYNYDVLQSGNTCLIERYSPLIIPTVLLEFYSAKIAIYKKIFNNMNKIQSAYGLGGADESPQLGDTNVYINSNYKPITENLLIDLSNLTFTILKVWYLYADYDSFNWGYQKNIGNKISIPLPIIQAFSVHIESDSNDVIDIIENSIKELSELYLFKDIDTGLDYFKEQIIKTFPNHDKVLMRWYGNNENYSGFGQWNNEYYLTAPSWYKEIIFVAANNNPWGELIPSNLSDSSNINSYVLFDDTQQTYNFTNIFDSIVPYEYQLIADLSSTSGAAGDPSGSHGILQQYLSAPGQLRTSPTGIVETSWIIAFGPYIETLEQTITRMDNTVYYTEEFLTTGEKNMPDSVRLKEIHAALDSGYFAYDPDDPEKNRIANLGYYIERIARVLGISVNPDGTIRSVRNNVRIDQDKVIPAGWNFAQFGLNHGGNTNPSQGQIGGKSTEIRDGLVYELKSNTLKKDGVIDKIQSGGYVLVENIPQFIHILMADLDRALGLQELGAFPLPTPNGGYEVYEGLHNVVTDIAYMISQLSDNITQTHVLSLKNNALLLETLRATGLNIGTKKIPITVDGKKSVIVNPAISEDSLTLADFLFMILNNLSLLVGSSITPTVTEE